MRVLVTGAGGFVGHYLVAHLQACGDEVLATDATSDRATPLDVSDPECCRAHISSFHPQVVYHLAGISFVPDAERDFGRTLQVNVAGVQHLLAACAAEQRPMTFVLVSSAEVYGRSAALTLPLTEETPLAPANNYGLSKQFAEMVATRFQSDTLRIVVMRPFNHIGPGQRADFVASTFAQQLALIAKGRSEPVLRVGNLDARRDFSDVRDVVRAYRLAAERGNGVYNLGAGRAVAVHELLDTLVAIAQCDVRIEPDPARMRPSETPELYASIARAQRELGWEPQISLRQSLEDIYRWWFERV